MRNSLLKFQLLHPDYFLKIARNSVCSLSARSLTESLLEYQTLSLWDSERKKNLPCLGNIRPLYTSVIRIEKFSEFSSNQKKTLENSLIYCGSLTYQVKGIKVFTCISSISGIVIQPWILQNILNGNNMPLGVVLLSCVGFFTFVTPFLIHLLTKKYVTEIWYNSVTNTYTATVLSFFLRRININFNAEDVKIPSVLPIFTTMYIKGKPVFIISDCFLEVEHYIKMMGYDKPLNHHDMKLNAGTNALDKSKNNEKL